MNNYKKLEKICYIIGAILQLAALIIFLTTDKPNGTTLMLFLSTGALWFVIGYLYKNKSKDDSRDK